MTEITRDTIPDHIREEAARWLARREGDEAGQSDPALRAWLGRDLRHRLAFAEAERMWRESLLLADSPIGKERSLHRAPVHMRRTTHLAVATCAVLLVVGALSVRLVAGNPVMNVGSVVEARTYQTGPGETRTWRLADGTDLTLLSASRAVTRFDPHVRLLDVQTGHAKIRTRTGDSRILDVRAAGAHLQTKDADLEVEVTGGTGRIDVVAGLGKAIGQDGSSRSVGPGEGINSEQKTVASKATSGDVQSAPPLATTREMTVGQAIALLNQRNAVQLRLAVPAIAEKRLAGGFRTDDPDSFARTLALLNNLDVERATGTIELKSRQ
ncbi:FecR domain-containing protein [Novosphingobium sp. CCH12-A3]|uniref:FecR domain-containing protein n=1 Tax=Novosphingobium sp. CCH12-A3 TaxID=1768752 RepID=UPI000783BF5A|nr:FecR domain-containing protein [Novosphingobium sp. CCH12-A3]